MRHLRKDWMKMPVPSGRTQNTSIFSLVLLEQSRIKILMAILTWVQLDRLRMTARSRMIWCTTSPIKRIKRSMAKRIRQICSVRQTACPSNCLISLRNPLRTRKTLLLKQVPRISPPVSSIRAKASIAGVICSWPALSTVISRFRRYLMTV